MPKGFLVTLLAYLRGVVETITGYLDYYRFPARRSGWGGPFNGQAGRKAVFDAIVGLQKPNLIVESGTYLGTTTEALAAAKVPVVTFENDRRNYGFARARLRNFANVELRLCDSRLGMKKLLQRKESFPGDGGLFAYLDAHWGADLPLAEELEIVFGWDSDAIVMIDDFQVPGDPGYRYDDYGPGKALTPDLVERACRTFGLEQLYPVLASASETGAKRGCVVLANKARWAGPLVSTGLLRRI